VTTPVKPEEKEEERPEVHVPFDVLNTSKSAGTSLTQPRDTDEKFFPHEDSKEIEEPLRSK